MKDNSIKEIVTALEVALKSRVEKYNKTEKEQAIEMAELANALRTLEMAIDNMRDSNPRLFELAKKD